MSWTDEQRDELAIVVANAHIAEGSSLPAVAITQLSLAIQQLVSFIEGLNLVEEHELRSFSGVLKAGEQSLQLEASLTSTSGLVFAEYRIVAPHELVLDGRPDQIRLTNGGDLLLDWAAPFTEDLLIVATKP